MEAAGEKSRGEQQVTGVLHGGRHRLLERSSRRRGLCRRVFRVALGDPQDERHADQSDRAQDHHRRLPARKADEELRQRDHGELSEGAAGVDDAGGHVTPGFRNPAAAGRHEQPRPDRSGAGGSEDAHHDHQFSDGGCERGGGGRRGDQQRTAEHYGSRPPAVRHRTGGGHGNCPHHLAHRESEADRGIAETRGRVDRPDEESLGLAHAQAQGEHGAGGEGDGKVAAGLLGHRRLIVTCKMQVSA